MNRIVFDIGNTTCRIAFARERSIERTAVLTHADVQAGFPLDAVLLGLASRELVEESVICSVAPALTGLAAERMEKRGIPALTVEVEDVPSLRLAYKIPGRLGADRFCSVLGARVLYGAPCIVTDMGTATTVNVVDGQGRYLGGAIGVGIRSGYRALHEYTALLPELEPKVPQGLIGDTTEESMHAGVTGLQLYGLKGYIEALRKELGAETTAVFTGGNMEIMPKTWINGALFDRNLLLSGACIYSDEKKTRKSDRP